MLEVRQGLQDDILLVGLHAAGAFPDSADGDALGKGHADAAGDHLVPGAGQVVLRQVIHAAHGCAVDAQGAADGALVPGGGDQRGDGGLRVDDGAHRRNGGLDGLGIAHQGAGDRDGHIVFQPVLGALVDGKGGEIIAVGLADHRADDGLHVGVGGNLVAQVLILGQGLLQLVSQHGLVDQLLVFRPEGIVFRLDIGPELHGPEIAGEGLRDAGEEGLDRGHGLADEHLRFPQDGRRRDDPVENIGGGEQHQGRRDQNQHDEPEGGMPPVGPAAGADGLEGIVVGRGEIPQTVPEIRRSGGLGIRRSGGSIPGLRSGGGGRSPAGGGACLFRPGTPQLAEGFLRRVGLGEGGSGIDGGLIIDEIIRHIGAGIFLFTAGEGTETGHRASPPYASWIGVLLWAGWDPERVRTGTCPEGTGVRPPRRGGPGA